MFILEHMPHPNDQMTKMKDKELKIKKMDNAKYYASNIWNIVQ